MTALLDPNRVHDIVDTMLRTIPDTQVRDYVSRCLQDRFGAPAYLGEAIQTPEKFAAFRIKAEFQTKQEVKGAGWYVGYDAAIGPLRILRMELIRLARQRGDTAAMEYAKELDLLNDVLKKADKLRNANPYVEGAVKIPAPEAVLIGAAAEAQEVFEIDELEQHAELLRRSATREELPNGELHGDD